MVLSEQPITLSTALLVGITTLGGVVVFVFKLWRSQETKHAEKSEEHHERYVGLMEKQAEERIEFTTRLSHIEGREDGVRMMIEKTMKAVASRNEKEAGGTE
tara:strand:+ start:809 stop:1114 length:306 start_codon:yes stop_codon:yes gene_type:complete